MLHASRSQNFNLFKIYYFHLFSFDQIFSFFTQTFAIIFVLHFIRLSELLPHSASLLLAFLVYSAPSLLASVLVRNSSRMSRRVPKRQPFYWAELSHFGNQHSAVQLSQDTRFHKAQERMPAEPEGGDLDLAVFLKTKSKK